MIENSNKKAVKSCKKMSTFGLNNIEIFILRRIILSDHSVSLVISTVDYMIRATTSQKSFFLKLPNIKFIMGYFRRSNICH